MAEVTNPNPIQKLRNLVIGDLDKLKARLVAAEDEAAVAKEVAASAQEAKDAAISAMKAAEETETEAIRRATEAEDALAEIQKQVGLLVGNGDDEAVPDTENDNDNRRRR